MKKALLLAVMCGFALLSGKHNNGPDAETHKRFDGVLYPEFTARMNDWALQHPRDEGHEQKFNMPDAKRYQAARLAWREMDEAAKAIGY